MLPYIVAVEHDKPRAVKGVGDGKGVNLLNETINYGKNSVIC